MLTFDIETTGLDGSKHRVTCISFYDDQTKTETNFVFNEPASSEDTRQKQLQATDMLDAADTLCAFNGARFDLGFIAKSWRISDEHLTTWMVKLVDVFQACRLALGITFPLNALLHSNGLSSKTGSGLEAIAMAERGEWGPLADYCMQDVLLTHKVTTLPVVRLPKTHLKWSMQTGFFQ